MHDRSRVAFLAEPSVLIMRYGSITLKSAVERIIEIRARSEQFKRELAGKEQRIKQLKAEGHRASVEAYVAGSNEFPSISEVAALESDIEDLKIKVGAARHATEVLSGQLAQVQSDNREAWIDTLKEREQLLMNQYADIHAQAMKIRDEWRQHASMVESVTGERVFTDFASPDKPILLKDPEQDEVIGTWSAGSIT
jgi:hypothetical protein